MNYVLVSIGFCSEMKNLKPKFKHLFVSRNVNKGEPISCDWCHCVIKLHSMCYRQLVSGKDPMYFHKKCFREKQTVYKNENRYE